MQTFSGKLVDLERFATSDVRLIDIAHSLSMLNRFTGHTTSPYSVAQHSVHVSTLVPKGMELWGLLHDASEAYLGDVATPLKAMLPCYREIEERVQRVIAKAFGLVWPMPPEVKEADCRALLGEKESLLLVEHDWGIACDPAFGGGVPMPWYEAKKAFSSRFRELVK